MRVISNNKNNSNDSVILEHGISDDEIDNGKESHAEKVGPGEDPLPYDANLLRSFLVIDVAPQQLNAIPQLLHRLAGLRLNVFFNLNLICSIFIGILPQREVQVPLQKILIATLVVAIACSYSFREGK